MIVPDSIDPIIAWRAWKFNELLGSLNSSNPVHPGVPQYAQCNALRNHEVPDERCTCGIYALPTLEAAVTILRGEAGTYSFVPRKYAIGQIYLWGKVVEHEGGWRAKYAYPKTILTDNMADGARLAKLYNIEVETSCTWEALFESDELNSWDQLYLLPNLYPSVFGGPPTLPPPSAVQQQKWNIARLPKAYQPKSANVHFNRSVPVPLRAQVAQKEENAKSDFWKRI